MKKILILAMSLLSTSLMASDFSCKIIDDLAKEKRDEVVIEGVVTADSQALETSFVTDKRDKLEASLSVTTFSEGEGEPGIFVNLDVKRDKLINFTGKTPRATAKFPMDAEKLEVILYSGGKHDDSYYITGLCERID